MALTKKRDITREEPSTSAPSTSSRDKRQRASRSRNPNYWVDLDDNDASLEILEALEESARRTQRDTRGSPGTINSWLIDMKVLKENQKVYVAGHEGLTGAITREGIMCHCCRKIFAIPEFGDHRVGFNTSNKDLLTLRKKVSLFSLQAEACKRLMNSSSGGCYNHIHPQDGYEDASDDSCTVCSDGGDLICCSTCPSTYHQSCLNIQGELPDDWACAYCCCRYCEGTDDEGRKLLACSQCQKKFHIECSGAEAANDHDERPSTFCSDGCRKIGAKLVNLLEVRNQIGNDQNLSWTLLRRVGREPDSNLDVSTNSKIGVALRVMEESFEPLFDRYTKINMIQGILLNSGSNFPRIDFSRFYTAILEHRDEVVSVATLRTHGSKLAEMPFVATSQFWRCKGMFKILLARIEWMLAKMGVEKLCIPSAEAMVERWITCFGFTHLTDELHREMLKTNCLKFMATTSLQKSIHQIPDLNLEPPEDE